MSKKQTFNMFTIALFFYPLLFNAQASNADPLSVQHKLIASDGTHGDQFSFSVAIFEDTALVGAIRSDDETIGVDAGSAYVYTRNQNRWTKQAKLTAKDGKAHDTVGGNVALTRDLAVLGAIGHDEKGDKAGAAYVFNRDGSTWTQETKLTAQDTKAGDAFGQSIATDGDFIVIGAPHASDKGKSSGSAYVFVRKGNKWVQQTKLIAADGAAGDVFGISVALSGNTLLVGADLHDAKANNAGAVYVYVFNGETWLQQAKLMADDGADTDIFGVRVALSGDTALISARRDDDETMGVDAGSAYVFVREGSTWHQQAKLTALDGSADDRFGRSVAIAGDTAIVGAMQQDDRGENSGSVYVFTRQNKHWTQQRQLYAQDGDSGDLFGFSISLSGKTAIVGAPRDETKGTNSGSSYIIELKSAQP